MSALSARRLGCEIFLACAALVAWVIGAALTFLPVQFRESYGLSTPLDASLLSEVRAPGGALVGLGVLMATGCLRAAWRPAGLAVAAATFLGYGLARVVGLLVDGRVSSDLLAAAAVELVVGAVAAWLLAQEPGARRTAGSVRTSSLAAGQAR